MSHPVSSYLEPSPYPLAAAVREAYKEGEDDETLEPYILTDEAGIPLGRIGAGHPVIFYDIRGEREIELTRAFVDPCFDEFLRPFDSTPFTTMIQYHPELPVQVAFPPLERLEDSLADVVSAAGRRLLKICESEKAVHLHFFFNGKKQEPAAGEERIVIESPRVADYASVPEMSAAGIGQALLKALGDGEHDLIVANFANVDVLGHIDNPAAIKKAIETVDSQVGAVVEAAREAGYTTVVTADHGTVERWTYPDGAIDTGHTDSPVPFILAPAEEEPYHLRAQGELIDVAPTILDLMGLEPPAAMTGRSLLLNHRPSRQQRVLLLILDGWGWREACPSNLISQADTPHMCRLETEFPMTLLLASGAAVGMPPGTVGNSEVGHLHLGAGRRIYSDRLRIDNSLEDGTFFHNSAFLQAMLLAKETGHPLHLLGIISFYSSHGSVEHLKALMNMAKIHGVKEVFIHGMLGRRGERPESGAEYVQEIEWEAKALGQCRLVSVIGRYWSLDREENWGRIEKTYRMLVQGIGRRVAPCQRSNPSSRHSPSEQS